MSEAVRNIEVPEGWISVPLSDCAEILDSRRIPLNSKERSVRIERKSQDQLFPYYGATGQVGFIDDFIFEGEHLLIGEDGAPFFDKSKNVAYLAKGKFWVNNHAHILQALKGVTSNKYLLHYLNKFNYKGFVGGTTRLKLNQANLKQIPVPLAPPEQQKRIVAKIEELFSHIDAGIEALKKAKHLLKQYRQSVLKAAVTGELTKEWRDAQGRASVAGGRTPGATEAKYETAQELLERILKERRQKWEEQQLEQFKAKGKMPKDDKWKEKYKEPEELELDIEDETLPAEWVTASLEMFGELYCGQSPSVSQVNNKGKGVLYVTGPEQWNGRNIEERKWTEHPKRLVPDGCIFITVKGAGVGKLFPGVACAIGRDVYAFKPHDELDFRYVINVLQHGINLVIAKAQGDIPGLSRNHIMEHAVGLPSIEEQKVICDSLEEKIIAIGRLEQSIEEQLIKSEKNKQSVLAAAFGGKLTQNAY